MAELASAKKQLVSATGSYALIPALGWLWGPDRCAPSGHSPGAGAPGTMDHRERAPHLLSSVLGEVTLAWCWSDDEEEEVRRQETGSRGKANGSQAESHGNQGWRIPGGLEIHPVGQGDGGHFKQSLFSLCVLGKPMLVNDTSRIPT